jgi:hypothetical protein
MDLDVQIVDDDPVAQIPVQAIGLFDQDGPAGRVASEVREHPAEAGPAAPFGRFDIGELVGDRDPVVEGVLAQKLLLGRDREAVFLLLFR